MPVDRMRMRPWLEEQINSGDVKGLQWINKQKKIFQIPWMHAARHGWDLDKDAPLFMNWAIHTGKYHPGVDQPDPKTWKANFRCAMNSLPDIEEVKDKSIKKGSNAFKVYRMLTAAERSANKEKKKLEKQQSKAKKLISDADTSCKEAVEPAFEEEEQVEHEADSTVTIVNDDSADDQLVIHEMPDVCAVVEVSTEHEGVLDFQLSTEREEPPVTSSTLYPRLQVSPISSCGESEAESDYSDDDSKEEWDMRCLSEPRTTCSVVRFPSSKPASKSTFFNSEKVNFKVTSYQEECPMISYNIRPWGTPHLTTRPVPARDQSGARPRHSSHLPTQISLHLHGQNYSFARPEDTQYVTPDIGAPVHPHASPQVAIQTSTNVHNQTISHLIAQRSPHLVVQPGPSLRPQITSNRSPLLRPSVMLQTSPHMPSPIRSLARPHMLYPSSLHMHLQSRSPLHPKTNRQLPLHSSPRISPHIHPSVHPLTPFHTSLNSSPQMSNQTCPDPPKSSKMRVLTRPDIGPHRNPGVVPRSSTHVPIMKKSHTSPFNLTRQSSPSERTHSTDGRTSVIVNTGGKSQPFMTPR